MVTESGRLVVRRGQRWFADANDNKASDGCGIDFCGDFGAATDIGVLFLTS